MKRTILSAAVTISFFTAYCQNTYPWPSTGKVGIGIANPMTINPSSSLMPASTPLVEMVTGNDWNNPYTELVSIRHIGTDVTGVTRQLGLFLKLSNESSITESNKMGGMLLESINTYSNTPTLSLLTSNAKRLSITAAGDIGIGTISPIGKFDVRGSTFIGTSDLSIGSTGSFVQIDQGANSGNSYTQIRAYSNGGTVTNNLVLQNSGGNVAIGTTDPQGYKLAVNGNMIAEEVKVKLHANWPDYVFKSSYKLPALSEIKTYIDQNQHLPEMPSANEVEKNGVNLGEMVKLQTKKIEELTLYLIEKDKQMEELKKQVELLTKEIRKKD